MAKRSSYFSLIVLLLQFNFCEAANHKTIYVNDRKTPCAGTYECLQIKEKAKGNWEISTDTISGLNYEEGYLYKLEVAVDEAKNTFTGVLYDKYRLVKIISKTKTNYKPAAKLENLTWHLQSLRGDKQGMTVKDTVVYMHFDAKSGKANGKGLCNTFNCSFKTEGSSISFQNFASTKMMCEGVEFEKIFFNLLSVAKTYSLEDNHLTIFCDGSREIVFTRE